MSFVKCVKGGLASAEQGGRTSPCYICKHVIVLRGDVFNES